MGPLQLPRTTRSLKHLTLWTTLSYMYLYIKKIASVASRITRLSQAISRYPCGLTNSDIPLGTNFFSFLISQCFSCYSGKGAPYDSRPLVYIALNEKCYHFKYSALRVALLRRVYLGKASNTTRGEFLAHRRMLQRLPHPNIKEMGVVVLPSRGS